MRKIKAGAVKYSAQEAKEIISSKLAERLQRQEQYREAYLTRLSKQARLNDFAEELNHRINNKLLGQFEMFGGHFSSLKHAQTEFQLELFYYDKAVKIENKLRGNLKDDGLTDAQIDGVVLEGKYIKYISEKQKEAEKQTGTDYVG